MKNVHDLVIVDEASYVSEEVFLAIEPAVATTNGSIILLSTPADNEGRFWEACNSPYWKQYHIPSWKSPLVSKEFLEEQKMAMTEVEFKREYGGEFTEEEENKLVVKETRKFERTVVPDDVYSAKVLDTSLSEIKSFIFQRTFFHLFFFNYTHFTSGNKITHSGHKYDNPDNNHRSHCPACSCITC